MCFTHYLVKFVSLVGWEAGSTALNAHAYTPGRSKNVRSWAGLGHYPHR